MTKGVSDKYHGNMKDAKFKEKGAWVRNVFMKVVWLELAIMNWEIIGKHRYRNTFGIVKTSGYARYLQDCD